MIGRSGLAGRALNSALADVVLRQRARSVFHQAGLFDHLPLTGLILEVGAGTGHLGEAVLRRMPSRQCVMADPVHVPPARLAGRMATRDFCAVRAGVGQLPFRDGRFDAAWGCFALRHLGPAARDGAAAELHRVVRPGGTMILVEDIGRLAAAGSDAWWALLLRHGWQKQQEIACTWLFPPMALRPVRHRAFVCRRAPS